MSSVLALIVYVISIAIIAVIAYFVIKKAVKDALKEHEYEKSHPHI